MEYEELTPISREAAAAVFKEDDAEGVSVAILRLALHDPDWRWVQKVCLRYAHHDDVWIRRNVVTALGHLARLHGELDVAAVMPVLQRLQQDSSVASWAEAAIDDLAVFLKTSPRE